VRGVEQFLERIQIVATAEIRHRQMVDEVRHFQRRGDHRDDVLPAIQRGNDLRVEGGIVEGGGRQDRDEDRLSGGEIVTLPAQIGIEAGSQPGVGLGVEQFEHRVPLVGTR